ncbi:MAG: CRISPR-associated endoribonuclease Cas6, partial [Thermoplasmata archaeon]
MSKADPSLAKWLHAWNGYRHYCFSNLIFEDRVRHKKGLMFNKAHFVLSSPEDSFLRAFTEGLLLYPEFKLQGRRICVRSVEILPSIEFGERVRFVTLSPIILKTKRMVDGELKERELYPREGKWHENLHSNLVARFEDFYGRPPEKDFFEVIKIRSFKGKRIKIAGDYRRCSLLDFDVQASEELIRFAYDAGLGEKNAMGFGCVEVEGRCS